MTDKLKFIVCVAGALSVAQLSNAAAVYSTGFESPITTGSINGQDGWLSTGPYVQSVTSGVGVGGSQGWVRTNQITGGTFGDAPYSHALPAGQGSGDGTGLGSQTNRVFSYSVQFKPSNLTPDNSFVSLSAADQGGGARINYARIDYDATNGLSVSVEDTTSNGPGVAADFNEYMIASNLDVNVFHTLSVTTIFNPGANDDQVLYSIDGMPSSLIGSWESYYKNDPEQAFNGNKTTGVDSVLFRTGGNGTTDNVATAGGIIFDNFSEAAVPEPASLGLLALGGVLLSRRTRKERATA